jgi:hypothetical protein
MAEKTKKPTKAVIIIKKSWADAAGVGDYLEPEKPHPQQSVAPFYAVPIAKFSLGDGWFLEIEFYPALLKGRPMKLFVPKQEVLAMLQGEKPEDRDKLGFLIRAPGS